MLYIWSEQDCEYEAYIWYMTSFVFLRAADTFQSAPGEHEGLIAALMVNNTG